MEPWFGEFQFAYSCTRELEDGNVHFPSWGPPYLPTQVQEGVLGYDVEFERAPVAPVFLQYKISDHLTRRNASEFDLFNRDYFRFRVYPENRSPQHNRLVEFATQGKSFGWTVYYCAPEFSGFKDYSALHAQRRIASSSVYVECSQLPDITGSSGHVVVYAPSSSKGYFCSDPLRSFPVVHGTSELVTLLRRTPGAFHTVAELLPRLRDMLAQGGLQGDADHSRRIIQARDFVALSSEAMRSFGLALGLVRQEPLEWPGLPREAKFD